MHPLSRRSFVQLSATALAATASKRAFAEAVRITSSDGNVTVKTALYSWSYAVADDTFRLLDSAGRVIVTGKLQPAIMVAPVDKVAQRVCSPGKPLPPRVEQDRVTFEYDAVNGSARLGFTWRFDPEGIWTDPVTYTASAAHEIVSLHYFSAGHVAANGESVQQMPSLHASFLVVPGISEGPAVSPIQRDVAHLDETVWLGRGSFIPGLNQQWGLPVHYFCGFTAPDSGPARNAYTAQRSDAFTCGLADLPQGDLFLQMYEGRSSPWIDYRSDLWHHLRTPGTVSLGATLYWSVAADYYASIAAYYRALLLKGIIHRPTPSAKKQAVMLTPEFCTWGAERNSDKTGANLDEAFLQNLYAQLKASGMKAGLFSIDDKWEGAYGRLEHATDRLPHFEQFLDRLRSDGLRIGLWAALMRCEHPSDLGLTENEMLKRPDGSPYLSLEFANTRYYILDFTQPKVAEVLAALVRRFIRRYKPDLFKFDFGYELPAAAIAAPHDKRYTGERLMSRGLDIVIQAMRAENPDIVVMYYNLSPLFLDYFDLHSTDDLFLAGGEYDVEANRRIYFSSLLGPLGVPTYGSSGYDWASAPEIWFDSAASGTVGSLNDFTGDEQGERNTPDAVARYNGIARVLRPATEFQIIPLGDISEAPTRGAHARSWARFEDGRLVLLAYRPPVPGQPNLLIAQSRTAPFRESQQDDPRIAGVVMSSVPVVVGSDGPLGITRSGRLKIVPYAPGEIVIRREQGTRAEGTHHFFGGGTAPAMVTIDGGLLRLAAVDRSAAGVPLEWTEVTLL